MLPQKIGWWKELYCFQWNGEECWNTIWHWILCKEDFPKHLFIIFHHEVCWFCHRCHSKHWVLCWWIQRFSQQNKVWCHDKSNNYMLFSQNEWQNPIHYKYVHICLDLLFWPDICHVWPKVKPLLCNLSWILLLE